MVAKKTTAKEAKEVEVTETVEAPAMAAADDFPMFDMSALTETYRKMTEDNMVKIEDSMSKVKSMSDETAKAFEDSIEVAKVDGTKLGLKTMDLVYSNISASMSHVEKLMAVKSLTDVMDLQSTYVTAQMDTLGAQVKELQEAGVKLSESVAAPVKAMAEKTIADLKFA